MSNKVLFGDCFDHLKKIENESIDLILTDPPYIISRKSNFKNGINKKYNNISLEFGDWDLSEIDLEYFIKESYRVLKKGGTFLIFYDIWKCSKIKQFCESVGFRQPRICQWVKSNPVPINSKINYLSNSVEYFFTFVKGVNPTFNSKYDRGIYNFPICHGHERLKHPTQKPVSLINDLIKKHSNEGDLILDPFGGSGTLAESCIFNNRNYIIIEKEKVYFDMIIRRLNQKKVI